MKIIFLILGYVMALQAIITIAPAKLGKKPGISGTLEGSFQTKRGNTDKDEYSAGLRLQYDNNASYLVWSDFIGVYGEANGERNTNKTYAHVRLVHDMIEYINWELFVQSETNEFTSVDKRRLGGGGLRFGYEDKSTGIVYCGIGAFYEYITYSTHIDPTEYNWRVNFYLAYVKEIKDKYKFAYVAYYQPKFGDIDDYITSQGVEFKMKIYEKLSIKLNLYYDYDATPATGREKTDFTQLTSFTYDF